VTYGQYVDTRGSGGWADVGRPESALDHNITATWAGDRLFLFGGVDDEQGFEAPSGPEAWLWAPPG